MDGTRMERDENHHHHPTKAEHDNVIGGDLQTHANM